MGVSTARTRHGRPAAAAWVRMALTSWTAPATGSRSGPLAPLPSRASTNRTRGRGAQAQQQLLGGGDEQLERPGGGHAWMTAQLWAAAAP